MPHIKAHFVNSPKKQWTLLDVLLDKGEGQPVYALGQWEALDANAILRKRYAVGFRWNGTALSPLGNPQSRGLPTWVMMDDDIIPYVYHLVLAHDRKMAAKMAVFFDNLG